MQNLSMVLLLFKCRDKDFLVHSLSKRDYIETLFGKFHSPQLSDISAIVHRRHKILMTLGNWVGASKSYSRVIGRGRFALAT